MRGPDGMPSSGLVGLPRAPSSVRSLHWPFVQWQDSGLWIRQWWFESTRANLSLSWSNLVIQLGAVQVYKTKRPARAARFGYVERSAEQPRVLRGPGRFFQ